MPVEAVADAQDPTIGFPDVCDELMQDPADDRVSSAADAILARILYDTGAEVPVAAFQSSI